jgi:hypothetical protein
MVKNSGKQSDKSKKSSKKKRTPNP